MFVLHLKNDDTDKTSVNHEMEELFAKRANLYLLLGIILFPVFSLLDFVRAKPFFWLFLYWRVLFAVYLLLVAALIRLKKDKVFVRILVTSTIFTSPFLITLMTIKLGGFSSDYYFGILLILATTFSVFPLKWKQSLVLGFSMFFMYIVAVYIATAPLDNEDLHHMINNSFFFLTMIGALSLQCHDEFKVLMQTFRARKKVQSLHKELGKYNENLESLIETKVLELQKTNTKFYDLYDNIPDMVVLLDSKGQVKTINRSGLVLLKKTKGEFLSSKMADFIKTEDISLFKTDVLIPLTQGNTVEGKQLQIHLSNNRLVDVEISAKVIQMPDDTEYQLIIRDISATKDMERQLLVSSQLLDDSRKSAIFGLARLAESRDGDTGIHLHRIRAYTRILALEMAKLSEYRDIIDGAYIDELCASSLLHDIGKIGIPDAILLKPGALSVEEFIAIQKHCEYGYQALVSAEKDSENLPFLRMGQEITLHHHEQWCGQGYPCRLVGSQIPLSARIVCLADVYDALTTQRPYKAAFPHEKARQLIIDDIGKRFDPRVGAAFLAQEEQFIQTAIQLKDNGTHNEAQ